MSAVNQLNTMLAIYSCLLTTAVITASPSLPSSGHIKIYPPAEPNYPPINPFRKSAPLPESDKAQSLLDAYALKFATNSAAEEAPSLRAAPSVRVSSAMHPSNYNIPPPLALSPHNQLRIPANSMHHDELVTANQPKDALAFKAISNPTAFFLQGAHLDKIEKPKCELTECEGPVPNDGSIRFAMQRKSSQSCYQTFVPMNSCVKDKGYPVGMVCTICCECSASFVSEMQNSRGFKIGLNRK